jgi:hypothetical protein
VVAHDAVEPVVRLPATDGAQIGEPGRLDRVLVVVAVAVLAPVSHTHQAAISRREPVAASTYEYRMQYRSLSGPTDEMSFWNSDGKFEHCVISTP